MGFISYCLSLSLYIMSSCLMCYSILMNLILQMHAGQRSICGVIVVNVNRFDLLDSDVMPIFMIIALDIFITMRFSINCSAVICSPTVIHAILREATSETYGRRVSFLLYDISFIYFASRLLFCNFYFPIYTTKISKIFTLLFYWISLLRVTVKGLITPLSHWLQGS